MHGAMSLDWLGGDALRSQYFNSLSMVFPSGERYFIESLRRVSGEIDDPHLRRQVQGFIGQESTHHRMHAEFNHGLEQLGLRNIIEPFIEWRIRHSQWLSPLDRLAITAGVEHFTSLFGATALRGDGWFAGGHPELRAFCMWHAAEEIEHGAIPLTLYNRLGGGYLRRVTWFFYVSVTLSLDALIQLFSNLHRSGSLWRTRTWLHGIAFLFGRGGPGQVALSGVPSYLRPGYVPVFDHANLLAQSWLAQNAFRFQRSHDA